MSEKITCGGDVHQATQTTETLGESQEIHLTEEFVRVFVPRDQAKDMIEAG